MGTKLQHESGEAPASQVTVHYDNKIVNLEVNDDGTVEVENKQQARQLLESHGEFKKLDDSEPDHVLSGKTVAEVEKYIRDVEDVERLKELRKLEDRKTGKDAIDNRIEEVRSEEETEDENHEELEEAEDEDGTENEE